MSDQPFGGQIVSKVMGHTRGLKDENHAFQSGMMDAVRPRKSATQHAKGLMRAAQHRPSVVFKFVRGGSCTSRASLGRQLDYIGSKSGAIIDPTNRYGDQQRLDRNDINRITRR